MSADKKRLWSIGNQTALRIDMLNLASGVEKSKIVDAAINMLFIAVAEIGKSGEGQSAETIRKIVEAMPLDEEMDLSKNRLPEDTVQLFEKLINIIFAANNKKDMVEKCDEKKKEK